MCNLKIKVPFTASCQVGKELKPNFTLELSKYVHFIVSFRVSFCSCTFFP